MKKTVIAAISGFAVGVAAGAVAMYAKCKLKYNKLMQEELREVNLEHEQELAKTKDYYESLAEYQAEDDIHEEPKEEAKVAEFARSKPAITDYTKFFKPQESPEADIPEMQELARTVQNADLKVPDIPFLKPNESVFDPPVQQPDYQDDDEEEDEDGDDTDEFYQERIDYRESEVITEDEVGELRNYDTDNLTLYSDGWLVDDMFNVIEEPEDIVTPYQLKEFTNSRDDILCVRSFKLRTDYQIVKDNRRWLDILKKKPFLTDD